MACGIIACVVGAFAPRANAGPAPAAELLRQAYVTLASADHDYKGHRVEAMKQVHAAGRVLGVNLHGDGKGHENQGQSDQQLRIAQGLLQQASAGLSGKALRHVAAAEKHLAIALTIR
jgi:hypothetical protein